MCETEQYVPSIDKDGFIIKSTQAVLGVLSKLKWKEGKDRCLSASPSLKLCYTFLYIYLLPVQKLCIFINYGRRNYSYTCNLSGRNNETDTFGNIWSSTFSALILLPAVFIGNPQILLIITTKVFVSVTLIGILSAGTSWNN